jgi:hypothetical protein
MRGRVHRSAKVRRARRIAPIRSAHPWGTPPWRIDFRPTERELPELVDFAIVGGGFSGLSAAAWLRRLAPGRSVIVLESASLGEGASGRTGGMALAETAAGKLPGLGNVLTGYRRILRALGIDSRLTLPSVWELGRSGGAKNSPISWSDSGELKAVRRVPGGTVDPGKVVAGLARAAENEGAQIVENAEVRGLDFSRPARLQVRYKVRGCIRRKEIRAEHVLLATNAFSLEMSGLRGGCRTETYLCAGDSSAVSGAAQGYWPLFAAAVLHRRLSLFVGTVAGSEWGHFRGGPSPCPDRLAHWRWREITLEQ